MKKNPHINCRYYYMLSSKSFCQVSMLIIPSPIFKQQQVPIYCFNNYFLFHFTTRCSKNYRYKNHDSQLLLFKKNCNLLLKNFFQLNLGTVLTLCYFCVTFDHCQSLYESYLIKIVGKSNYNFHTQFFFTKNKLIPVTPQP